MEFFIVSPPHVNRMEPGVIGSSREKFLATPMKRAPVAFRLRSSAGLDLSLLDT